MLVDAARSTALDLAGGSVALIGMAIIVGGWLRSGAGSAVWSRC